MRALDPLGLASCAGGLQLLPANGNSLWRLDVLASLAGGHAAPVDPQEELNRGVIDWLLNASKLANLGSMQEDPHEDLLCEEVAFHGGSFLVGGGMASSATFVFRALSLGLFASGELPTDLATELTNCAAGAVILSDAALRGAGLHRNVEPGPLRDSVHLPSAAEISELQRATAFNAERLRALINPKQAEAIEPLIQEAGSHQFSDEEIFSDSGPRRPFLRAGEWLVLHRPFDVLDALRHHFSLRVTEVCGTKVTAEAFHRVVEDDVSTAFRRMGLEPIEDEEFAGGLGYTEMRYRCDSDKQVVALILTDDFVGIEEDNAYTMWEGHEHIDKAKERIEAIAEADARDEEVLGLIVMQAAGRHLMLLTPYADSPGVFFETLTASDLDTIGILETGSKLGLWKYAAAGHTLGEDSRITASSALDIYGVYRGYGRSFAQLADATGVLIPPGSGGPYRREAKAGRDRHGEPHPNRSIREVEREDPQNHLDRLIYHETLITEPRQSLFVSGADLALWVAGPERDVVASWDAVDTVAYWLSELTGAMESVFDRLSPLLSSLLIEAEFSPWDYWFGQSDDPGGDDTYRIEVVRPRVIKIELGTTVRRLLLKPDNVGDRLIVEALIEAISIAMTAVGEEPIHPDLRDRVIDEVAPRGIKKHLISFRIDGNPTMEPLRGRPRLRQEGDRTTAEVDLASHLFSYLGYKGRAVPREQRNDVLKEAVAHLFRRAIASFEGVSPEGLLEKLAYANELLLQKSEHSRAILPARLATYPAVSQTLRDEVSDTNLAGICCRFLIEYAAACPPSGDAPWSTARYDSALASVAELLQWADLSDAVRGGLTDVDLLIRDDGRLRLLEADSYDSGRGAFFAEYLNQQKQQATDRWGDMFEDSEAGVAAEFERLNDLMHDEASVSLFDLGELLVGANLVARERDEEVVCLPYEEGIQALAEQLERDPRRIIPAIDYLCIEPRADFFQPPSGTRTDTYPWLFARRWSYNRRPFLRRSLDGAAELIWGRRHVLQAMHILFGQLSTGHYQALAETDSLRRALGRIAKEAGSNFEQETLDILRSAGWRAHRGVKRLNKVRLQRPNGQPLGDIDVLAGKEGSRTLWAVECKALIGSLSSAEVSREMSGHFRPAESTSVAKHVERVRWLQEHSQAAAELLKLDGGEACEVRGLIVTARDVIAPYIDDIPFEIVSIGRLPAFLEAASS